MKLTIKFTKIPKLAIIFLLVLLTTSLYNCQREQGKSVAQTENEELKASLVEPTRSLSPDFLGYNATSVSVTSWQDPSFLSAVNKLNPKTIRIPGGEESNYWYWQRGGLIEDISSLPEGLPFFLRWEAREYTASTMDNYQHGLQATNTTPIFVLNMLTADLQSQLEMLRNARNLGIPIKYVELGNEFYWPIPNYTKVFSNPEDYARVASEWTAAIKQEFPEAQIAVLGFIPESQDSDRQQKWNQSLLSSALPQADAITLHLYGSHGLDAGQYSESEYPFFSESDVPKIFGEPFRNWQRITNDKNYKIIPQDKKIWLTEYNLFEQIFGANEGQKPKVMGSWAHGIYAATMSMLFLEEPRIETISNHTLVGNAMFGAILGDEKGFTQFEPSLASTPMSLSATGSALALLGNATEDMDQAQKIDFAGNYDLTGKDGITYPAIYGWQFSNEKNNRAIALNLSDRPVTVDVSSLFAQQFNYEQLSGDPRLVVTGSKILTHTMGSNSSEITLPAYSVTKLSSD